MRVRNDADAEDIVQTAFLAARRAYPEKGIEELRPLIFTLVRNAALDHLRASWNTRRHGEDFSALNERTPCLASHSPEKQLMDSDRLALVESIVAGMSPRRQTALRLHRYDGLSYEEIARRLSISSTAVKKHVALGVAEIAARLAEAEDPV
jgi:RNA polymerase sigma-70 factor (ECF subfamily)